MARRKLGRGLDMLISSGKNEPAEGNEPRPESDEAVGAGIVQLDPAAVEVNPEQPRQRFSTEELEALKASIAREGLLQPILVRRLGAGYQLVAGERRLRAVQDLGFEKVPAMLVDLPDGRLLEVALIENVHRENLDPIELATAYRHLMELKGWTQEALAEELRISRPAVANTVRLLELPEDMREALVGGKIHMGHAKVLLSIRDPGARRALFKKISSDKLSVRELELERDVESVPKKPSSGNGAGAGSRRKKRKGSAAAKKPYLVTLEEELGEALGTRVRISEKGGKGVLSVEFYSKDDFERLRSLLLAAR